MAEVTTNAVTGSLERKRRSPIVSFLSRLFREKRIGAVGGVIVLMLLFGGIFADLLAPYDYAEVNIKDRLDGSSAEHWLGADQLGRDVLSRIIAGARVSLIVGLSGAAINAAVGAIIGTISAFYGGKLDLVIQRFVDAWMSIPWLLVLMTIMSLVGRGMPQIILVLGITAGIGGSRIARSAVMSIKETVYLMAARAIGVSIGRTIFRHILPNIAAPILMVFTNGIGGMIVAEASLSFLGFGLPPDVPSWGGMLSGEGRKYMEFAPHLALWPGLALTIVVWGANMFGDALRDLLDPRLRGGVGGYGRRI
jgi:peptide/nickel transport system permease protein